MKYFTPEDLRPAAETLSIIRRFAYDYSAMKLSKNSKYCVN